MEQTIKRWKFGERFNVMVQRSIRIVAAGL